MHSWSGFITLNYITSNAPLKKKVGTPFRSQREAQGHQQAQGWAPCTTAASSTQVTIKHSLKFACNHELYQVTRRSGHPQGGCWYHSILHGPSAHSRINLGFQGAYMSSNIGARAVHLAQHARTMQVNRRAKFESSKQHKVTSWHQLPSHLLYGWCFSAKLQNVVDTLQVRCDMLQPQNDIMASATITIFTCWCVCLWPCRIFCRCSRL
jgi:hypothetical protein